MMIRTALITILLSTPALAQEAVDCGACTDLDRATMAEPVTAPPLPVQIRPMATPDRGQPVDLNVPGVPLPPVYFKPGAGLWVSDATPGGVFVKPKNNKFSIDLRF